MRGKGAGINYPAELSRIATTHSLLVANLIKPATPVSYFTPRHRTPVCPITEYQFSGYDAKSSIEAAHGLRTLTYGVLLS